MLFGAGVFISTFVSATPQEARSSPIHFTGHTLPFTLNSGESSERHAPETMAGGVALFDYDRDGDLDLFFANGANIKTLTKSGPQYSNRLFRNNGKGEFEDVTERSGLAGTGFDNGVAAGDYDHDGFQDLFVGGVRTVALYHNNHDGTFSNVTEKAGLGKPDADLGPLWSVGGAWVDVNRDGLLDLFVVNYVQWDPAKEPVCGDQGHREYCHPKFFGKLPNQLFLNNGDGTFADASAAYGLRAHPGKGMGVGVADYDHDGWPDLFVANDKSFNFLFHNVQGKKFEEVALSAGVSLSENGEFISGMGVDFRDLDNDGFADISVVALGDETFPLFHNTGKGEFEDVTGASGMGTQSLTMAGYSPLIADFDNDGWKDIFVTRGHVQSPLAEPRTVVNQPNSVFRNLGKMKFRALTAEAGLTAQPSRRHRGSVVGDLNGDGRLDLVVTALGAAPEIWINDSEPKQHWVGFALEGTTSNRDAIGAEVQLTTATGVQFNHVSFAGGYASSSAGPLHFGLGAQAMIDQVDVRWPSGKTLQLKNVKADQVLTIKEP